MQFVFGTHNLESEKRKPILQGKATSVIDITILIHQH